MSDHQSLTTIRQLALCYQAFERFSLSQISAFDLTHRQFDIIATLGNTAGMTPKELTEKTLITKGTLTGVINRMVEKGLVKRIPSSQDGRSQVIQLTAAGNKKFNKTFPVVLAAMDEAFSNARFDDHQNIQDNLKDLRDIFTGDKQ